MPMTTTPMLITKAQYLKAIEQGKASAAQLSDWNSRQRLMDRDDSDEIYEAFRTLAELSASKSKRSRSCRSTN